MINAKYGRIINLGSSVMLEPTENMVASASEEQRLQRIVKRHL